MKRVVFLACETTLPGLPTRRADAYEFDHQFGVLRKACEARDIELVARDWAAPMDALAGDAVVIGTPWNYQEHEQRFLARLEELDKVQGRVFNAPALVAWNLRKTYLRALDDAGVRTIPTRWTDVPTADDVEQLFARFDCAAVVVKRQVGAGAAGQRLFRRGETLPQGPLLDRPAMLQPFLSSIQREGELSFVFIDGAYSHAILKTARAGDYRIQSLFGGREKAVSPSPSDVAEARAVLDEVPFVLPLYARIDMIRDDEGHLCLMEAEMIEPYLYPLEGPGLGALYADALLRRLA